MSEICLCLAIHEPYCLRRYTVFDVGESSVYEDDDRSCQLAMNAARNCYLPMNEILFRQILRYKDDFTLALSISDSALDLFEQYTPEVITSLTALAKTGQVEFISEAGPHTLAFLYDKEEFVNQVRDHTDRLEKLFGRKPTTFRNSELLYSDDVAKNVEQLEFSAILTEGAPEILGWRNPNYVYSAAAAPTIRLLLRNPELSANISQNFSNKNWSEWPLTSEKFASWCAQSENNADILNIFLDFHAFGLRNSKESGIFSFMESLPKAVLAYKNLHFMTPHAIVKKYESKDKLKVPNYISWNDEGSDIRGWFGNEMQKDALQSVYALAHRVRGLNNEDLTKDYARLQTSDYFHYMSTRWFSESQPDRPNPYQSPYDAYISYMNILKDFTNRLTVEEVKKEKEQMKNATEATGSTPSEATKKVLARHVGSEAITPLGQEMADAQLSKKPRVHTHRRDAQRFHK